MLIFVWGGEGSVGEFQHPLYTPRKTNLETQAEWGFGIGSGFSILVFRCKKRVMFEEFHVHLLGEIVQIRHHQILFETRPSKIHIVIYTLGKGPLTSWRDQSLTPPDVMNIMLLLMEELRRSPVEVGSLSHYLQGFSTIQPVVVTGFPKHHQEISRNMNRGCSHFHVQFDVYQDSRPSSNRHQNMFQQKNTHQLILEWFACDQRSSTTNGFYLRVSSLGRELQMILSTYLQFHQKLGARNIRYKMVYTLGVQILCFLLWQWTSRKRCSRSFAS